MATSNPFLTSPFDEIANKAQEDTGGILPGQQAVKSAPKLDMPKADKAPAAAPAQDPTDEARRQAKTEHYLPPDEYRPLFEAAAQKYDVPANVLMALAHQESRYNPRAIGEETQWGRAKGILQNLDATAKGLGINPFDPAEAIPAAARQIRERLDKGVSMIDAVKEHFAGPDRANWGKKTEAYGREVMEKVGKIGSLLLGSDAQAAEATSDVPKDWVKLTPEQAAAYEAKQAGAVPNPLTPSATGQTNPAERGIVSEYITDPLKRGALGLKQGAYANSAMSNARILAAIGKIDRGEKVLDAEDVLGYQYMNTQQRAKYKQMMGDAFQGAVKVTTDTGKSIQEIPQDPIVAAASNAKSFDEWWGYFKQKPFKFIANTGVESLPNMAPGLVLGAGAGLAAQATMKAGGLVAGAAGMGAGSYAVDYPSTVLSALQDMGIDTNNADALAKAFSDPKVMKDVQNQAHAHATVVGGFDAASGGAAGKTLVAGKTLAKKALNMGAQTGVQGALGASGEAGGQIAQGKKDLEWGAIMGEFAGEMAGAPVEMAGAAKLKAHEALAARRGAVKPAATPVEAPPSVPPPTPSNAPGPLARSTENAAEQHASQPDRVVMSTPQGSASGTLAGYHEDAEGNFVAQIVGDDGEVHQVTSADGVQITPEAKADSGPLTASLSAAADEHQINPAPAPARPPAPPSPPDYSTMPLEDLRARLKYVADQAKNSGGWNKMLMANRKEVEREINQRTADAKAESKLSEEPMSSGPFDDRVPANKMALRMAEATGTPHEVIEAKGKFTVQPIKEVGDAVPATQKNGNLPASAMPHDQLPSTAVAADEQSADVTTAAVDASIKPSKLTAKKSKEKTNVRPATPVSGMGDERADGTAAPAQAGSDQQRGRKGNQNPVAGTQADAAPAIADARPGVPDAGATANGQPALKDAHAGKWFSSREKADAYIVKRAATDTHEVVQTGKVRFEVKPRAAAQIDAAAHEAATSPLNDLAQPTDAQKEAGNYTKGHATVHGLDITIENPRGSERSGKRPDGSTWSHKMSDHYGYIKRTIGADGEQVDVYVGPQPESDRVYVVDQTDQKTGGFDEHKAMIGFSSQDEAIAAYSSNFDKGWKVGPVKDMSIDEFKAWLRDGDTKKPASESAPTAAPKAERQGLPKSVSVGPMTFTPKGIDKVLYRETNTDGLDDLLRYHNGGSVSQAFLSDNEELAIGQGDNTGVKVQFRSGAVSGGEHAKPGTGDIAGREYRADFIGPDAIDKITMSKEAKLRGISKRVLTEHFDKTELPNGLVQYVRKGYSPPVAAAGKVPKLAPTEQQVVAGSDTVATAGGSRPAPVAEMREDLLKHAVNLAQETIQGEIDSGELDDIHSFEDLPNDVDPNSYIYDAESGMSDEINAGREAMGWDTDSVDENLIKFINDGVEAISMWLKNGRVGSATQYLKQAKEMGKVRDMTRSARNAANAARSVEVQKLIGKPVDLGESEPTETAGQVDDAPAAEKTPKKSAAEKRQPEKTEMSAPDADTSVAPIADFGEKIHGARKDLWASFKNTMREALPDNVKDITLAKHFPEPNYDALIEAGVDQKVLAAMKAMRDEIPAKPRMPYKAKRWGEQVQVLRDFANDLLDGKRTADELLAEMRKVPLLRKFADRIEVYAHLGYPMFTKAKNYEVDSSHYTVFNGEQYPNGIVKYTVSENGRARKYADTLPEAIMELREILSATSPTSGAKTVKLGLYRTTGSRDIIIGKKVGAGKYIDLKGGFTDVRSARAYLAENQADLEKLLEQKKDVRPERRSVNDPRVGEDRRKGADVTPEQFGTTFGFRGVQFGNYVEQKRRARDLNNAYDALLDLADLLNVPPAALSLNGTLGLAFGARGAGGKNAAAAHFEPDNIVINLTKTNGAGSLAHEWFHGLDNYFERMRGAKGAGHVTDRPTVRKIQAADRTLVDDDSIRPEVLEAVKGVMDAIKASGMPKRSAQLDARRSKDYWSTTHELAARAFESYIIDKAAENGQSNDYLANIVSEDAHKVIDEMVGSAEPFPYPTRAEAPAINSAFDKLFATIETRDDGGKPIMYSVAGDGHGSIGARIQEELYAGRSSILDSEDRLDGANLLDAEAGLTDEEYEKRTKNWHDEVGVPLNDADAARVIERVNAMTWYHGSRDHGTERLELRSAGGLFLTSDPGVADHYAGKGGRIYDTKVEVKKPFFVQTSDLTASIESSGEISRLQARGYDAIVPLDYGDIVLLKKSDRTRPEVRYSTTDDSAFTLMTPDQVKEAITTGPVGSVIARLIENGSIVLHRSAKTLPKEAGKVPNGVQAVTMPDGTIHVVSGSLTKKNARAVLLHEAFHQGTEKLIGTTEWSNLMGRMGSLHRQSEQSSGKAREFYDRARARVASAKDKGAVSTKMEVEEFAAYAIEEYETARDNMPAAVRKWVEDLIGMVKAWMVKRYGKQLGPITPAQLSAMAKLAIMDVAVTRRGELFGQMGEWFSMGDERTVEIDGVRRPITNSNGQVISDEFQKQQAFWRWFDNSKVVDADGKPLVSYHGTMSSFSEFKKPEHGGTYGDGIYFSTDVRESNVWAGDLSEDGEGQKDGGNVIPVYLRIINPASEELASELESRHGPETSKILKERGYDGIITTDGEIVVFDPGQIKSAIGNNGEFDLANPDFRYSVADDTSTESNAGGAVDVPPGLTPPEQGLLRRVQSQIQDNFNRVRQVQERIMELTGRTTLGKSDYYGAETNRPGRIAARLEDARDKLTGPLMAKLAKSGYTQEQLSELLHAMHAQERNERVAEINPAMPDGGSGMTTAQADSILARHEGNSELHALAQQARDIARATLDLKMAYGLIKEEDHATLATSYENYVPLKGDGEFGPKIKRAMGHEGRDELILDNIARDYDQAVVVGEKNLARQSLLRMVLQFADADLWTARVPPRGRYVAGQVFNITKDGKTVASFDSRSQVSAWLEAKGAEASNYTVLNSNGDHVTEFVKPLQDNEVMVYVKGDPVRIQIHDEKLAAQLRPLGKDQLHPILEFMRSVNRYLSKIYTGYNPAFILRNTARDAMTGTINMLGNEGGAVAAKAWMKYPSALKAMGQWAATKKAPNGKIGSYLTEYRMHGGKVGASWMSDLEQQGKTLQAMFDDAYGATGYLRDGRTGKAAVVAGRKIVGGMAHIVEIANQATENALRLSLYIALREEGATPGRAAQAAKSVTVDFDRKGSSTAALGAIYLFFNPAVQGSANALKTLAKGEHKGQAWAALGGLAALGVYAASQGMGDDKNRWLGEGWETRSKNFMLNIGGRQIRVPVSQEFAPMYAFGVAAAEAAHGEKKMKSAVRMVSSFIDAYFPLHGAFIDGSDNHLLDLSMSAVPTALKPLSESAANRNSFGSQVVPESELTKDRPDNLKMFRGTKNTVYDRAAQAIAAGGVMSGFSGQYENDITKVSPETLKSLWRTYTGGLGQFVTDTAGIAAMTASDPSQVNMSDVPIVKDFVRTNDVKPIRGRYYDLSREAHAAITEFEQAKKLGDADAMDALFKDEGKAKLVGLGRMVRATNKAAAAVRDEEVTINADKSLTSAEKREKLKAIEKDEEALYRAAIDAFK